MLTKKNVLERFKETLRSESNLLPQKKECFEESIKKIESLDEITADSLIKKLDLKSITGTTEEEGFFKEFVNTDEVESQTEIFYLLKDKQVSCLHALNTTETWNWLGGNEISLFIFSTQEIEEIVLNENRPSFTIEKGTLFGAKITTLTDDNDYVLVTCLCKPRFELNHYINPPAKQIADLRDFYKGNEELIDELKPKASETKKSIFQSLFQFFSRCCKTEKDEERTPLINPSRNY